MPPLPPATPPPPVMYGAPVTYGAPAPARRDNLTTVIVIIVLACTALPVVAILAAILFPVFAKAREKARQSSCASNVKQLELGLLMYCQDYDQRFPPGLPGRSAVEMPVASPAAYPTGDWRSAILPYTRSNELFLCPTTNTRDSYEFNDKLYGLGIARVTSPAETATLFDKGFLTAPGDGPHNLGHNIGFTDGHVRWYAERGSVRTEP
jgi:prepilin-type processing-associated H-X9-DG protein